MSTGLMPVDEVTAFYDPGRRQLSLSARGSVQPKTNDICFRRSRPDRSTAAAAVFELVGTTYAVVGPKRPYSAQQSEDGVVLRPGQDVRVKTANHPGGRAIEVFWGGLARDSDEEVEGARVDHTKGSNAISGMTSARVAPTV